MNIWHKILIVLLLLCSLVFAEEQVRAGWFPWYSSEDHDFIDKQARLNLNMAKMTSKSILFQYRDGDEVDSLVSDLADSLGYKTYVIFFLQMYLNKGMVDEVDHTKWQLHPINMTNSQYEIAVNALSDETRRGWTAYMDKSSPYVQRQVINEVVKWADEYPEIDGFTFDYSRFEIGLGSWADTSRKLLQEVTDLDTNFLADSVFGAFPAPVWRSKGYSASSLDDNTKSLADLDGGGSAITLRDANNGGFVLSSRIRFGMTDTPLWKEITQKYIDSTGYSGSDMYVVMDTTNGIEDVMWNRGQYDREWCYAMDYTPVVIKNFEDVPSGAPVVMGGVWDLTQGAIDSLLDIANSGSCVIDMCSLWGSGTTADVKDSLKSFLGFSGTGYFNGTNRYASLTTDGEDEGFESTQMTAQEKITKDSTWLEYNSNEILGGIFFELRKIMKERYKAGTDESRKEIVGTVHIDSTAFRRGQDWEYWIENGYNDWLDAMVYNTDSAGFVEEFEYADSVLGDLHTRYIPMIHMSGSGPSTAEGVIQQMNGAIEDKNKLGYAFFITGSGIDDWTDAQMDSIGNADIVNTSSTIPTYNDLAIVRTGQVYHTTPTLSWDVSNIDSQSVEDGDSLTLLLSNIGEDSSFIDMADIVTPNLDDTIPYHNSTIIDSGDTVTLDFVLTGSYAGTYQDSIMFYTNSSLQHDSSRDEIVLFFGADTVDTTFVIDDTSFFKYDTSAASHTFSFKFQTDTTKMKVIGYDTSGTVFSGSDMVIIGFVDADGYYRFHALGTLSDSINTSGTVLKLQMVPKLAGTDTLKVRGADSTDKTIEILSE